jgi:membrane protein DedA with SNARE-associated domain
MPLLASITQPIVDWATGVVGDLGLPGIFLLMLPESAGIPIPSEATMLFAGFNVHKGEYSLFAAVAVGTIANVLGSWILYAIGYYGRSEVLLKHGRKIHVTPERIEQADRWFEKYGSWAVFFSRMLPIVRTFISLPAGVARMPFWKFTLFTFLGCLPWILMLTLVGRAAGANWEDWQSKLHYVDYLAVVLILAGAGYLAYRWYRGRGNGTGGPADLAPATSDAPPAV